MKYLFIGLALIIISCEQSQFCGHPIDENEFSHLEGKMDGNGFNIGVELLFAVAKELNNNSIKFETVYSTKDTIVLNVVNIPNEKFARKISCLISRNKKMKKTEIVYVRYILINENKKAFKY